MGKTLFDFIHFSKENSPKMSIGGRAQFMSTISLKSCYMKINSLSTCSDVEKCLSFRFPHNSEAVVLQQVRVIVTAAELGEKDISPLDVHSYNNTSTDKLPEDQRPRTREVIFFYIYNNDRLHKTQGPYAQRIVWALKLKGIEYETMFEDLANKSRLLLEYNPVHKKVPVWLHDGAPICESLLILEYADDKWNTTARLLPDGPLARATTRFWAKFWDDQIVGRKLYPREKAFNFW
ncbi:putative glutathione transferase [Helianthus annuus]|nr:putative glutathione transferase [Helianthus annuus]